MPETEIIKRYFALGGEIITVGSDAHFPSAVGRGVASVLETLKHIGFKYVCAFDGRKPRFIPIS
jgi:histidinol-phosphatase (PHP family)